MTKFVLSIHDNNERNFLHVLNFLVSYKVSSLEDSIGFYKRFKSSEEIEVKVLDKLANKFANCLDSDNWIYDTVDQ